MQDWFRPNEEFYQGDDAATQAARARLREIGVGTPIEPWDASHLKPQSPVEESADELVGERVGGPFLVKP